MVGVISRDSVRSHVQEASIEQMVEESMSTLPPWMQGLSSKVSHGIRTPLTSIVGFEEVLGEDAAMTEEMKQEFGQIIQDERERLVRFLMCIRMFELMKKNRLSIEVTSGNAATTVKQAHEAFKGVAKRRGVELHCCVPETDLECVADHRQLQLAVELMIANALSVTGPGGKVDVAVKMLPSGLSISVEDTGCGIARHQLPYVFVPFTRVDHPDDSGSELGLGLTVARQIVTLHGGRIDAVSIPTRGSRFRIFIPR